jgi:CRP/FNR family transcriptional regulator, anaerobic regulatory protein
MAAGVSEAHFAFFEQLSDTGRRELLSHPVQRIEGSKLLLSRGDPVDGAYLVVGGAIRIFYLTAEGREATLYRVEPGGTCILALTATFNREPYPAWVESAPQGVSLVRVPSPGFRRLFDGEVAFRDFIFGVLSSRVFELMQVLEEAGTARIEQRLAKFLLREAGADSTVVASQARIASEIGTAREVVFRALRSLASRGLVKTGRVRVSIVDPDGLRSVATSNG